MLEITPVLRADDLLQTVRAIAAVQSPEGAIPEFPDGVVNPWNHIEAAMALDVGGQTRAAERAYRWLSSTQRADGAWAAGYLGAEVVDHTLDANFISYVAFGVWHHYVVTGDAGFLSRMWPVLDKAIGFALGLQRPDGAISWARDAKGRAARGALLTSCACIHMSLRSGLRAAAALGVERPEWEMAMTRLGESIRAGDHLFEAKARFSMDWYYPVLARVVTGDAAAARLRERWEDFVVEGLGVRCVSDRPWVTSGETAELALALNAAGMALEAQRLLEWVQHLRADDGAYWIGATFPDGTVWPQQKPTWGSGSVVLAADVLSGGASAACF